MDGKLYLHYLNEFVTEAIHNSDGTKTGIINYLLNIPGPGRLSRHREEKTKALHDAQQAFNEHRHWPLEIILSHLGVEVKEYRR
jgi:hypothetical protein